MKFRPLTGAPISVAAKDHVLAKGGHEAAGPGSFKAQVVALATELAGGGDLSVLLPPRDTAAWGGTDMGGISKLLAAVSMVVGLTIIGFQVMVAVRSTQLFEVYAGWGGDTIEDYNDRSAPPPEEVKVGGRSFTLMTPPEGRRVHRTMEAMLRTPERAMEHRTAQITTVISANDLLKEGEALPGKDMLELMVNARATRLAEDHCALMLETLAAKCVVTHVHTGNLISGNPEVAGRNLFELNSTMVFLPKVPLGTLPEGEALVVHQKRVSLDFVPPLQEVEHAQTEAVMRDTLAAFASACNDLRETHGNCMVLEPTLSVSARREQLNRHVTLVYLAPMQVAAEVVE